MTAPPAALGGGDPAGWYCRTCRAEPGRPCRRPGGEWTHTHADRREAVRLWLRYGQGGRA
jgi:hypothetical protein